MVKFNFDFKSHIKKYILKNKLFKKNHNSIYDLDYILDVIEYILKTGASWRTLDLAIFKKNNTKWQSIYYHFEKFSKAKVFENVYKELLTTYFKKNKSGKLKYISVDAAFIKNKYASNVAFNGFCKKKKLSKLSLFVDSYGVPLSALLVKGNKNDCSIFDDNWKDMFVEIESHTNNNKHKRYILADTAYDSKKIHEKIKSKNITPIIWQHGRRKNITKFNKHEREIYNKRIIVENCFSWLFKNHRIERRMDKLTRNYYSFMYIAFIRILLKRM